MSSGVDRGAGSSGSGSSVNGLSRGAESDGSSSGSSSSSSSGSSSSSVVVASKRARVRGGRHVWAPVSPQHLLDLLLACQDADLPPPLLLPLISHLADLCCSGSSSSESSISTTTLPTAAPAMPGAQPPLGLPLPLPGVVDLVCAMTASPRVLVEAGLAGSLEQLLRRLAPHLEQLGGEERQRLGKALAQAASVMEGQQQQRQGQHEGQQGGQGGRGGSVFFSGLPGAGEAVERVRRLSGGGAT